MINIRHQLDGESDKHTFMACSALDFEWMEQLPDAPPENIPFIAEGLLNYFASARNRFRSRTAALKSRLEISFRLERAASN